MSTLKYCSTVEIVFVYFREDNENFILELCFFTTKYALYLFLFLQVQSIKPKLRAFNLKLKSISTSEFQLRLRQKMECFFCLRMKFYSYFKYEFISILFFFIIYSLLIKSTMVLDSFSFIMRKHADKVKRIHMENSHPSQKIYYIKRIRIKKHLFYFRLNLYLICEQGSIKL